MAEPFSFPPPPPPPRRREDLPTPNFAPSGYASSHGNGNRIGTDAYSGGRGRAGSFRGRVFSSRGRGRAGSYRGDHRNGNCHASFNHQGPAHESPRVSTQNSLNQETSLPSLYQGQKRPHSAAFNKPVQQVPRPQAAPAVPSFGGDILPPSASRSLSPSVTGRKKARKHNQLGLTPSSQDHLSSSEDDDLTKLATAPASAANPTCLQIEYKGRITTLRTAADIAAWIAERKRNFPTIAKAEAAKREAEEKRRQLEEAKKARAEAERLQKIERDNSRQEDLRRRALESIGAKKRREEDAGKLPAEENKGTKEKAAKATTKVEKLKRKLEKAQSDARKAEAELAKMQEIAPTPDGARNQDTETKAAEMEHKSKPAGRLATPPAAGNQIAKLRTEVLGDDDIDLLMGSNTSSALSLSDSDGEDNDEDTTSSSGDSLSSSISHSTSDSGADSNPDSASDSAPEEQTSKRTEPDRIPPPPRPDSTKTSPIIDPSQQQGSTPRAQNLCRNLRKGGRCQFGARCRFSHDIPEELKRGTRQGHSNSRHGRRQDGQGEEKTVMRERRKGLYQLFVEKEMEEERRAVLDVIVQMGDKGLLGDEEPGGTSPTEKER